MVSQGSPTSRFPHVNMLFTSAPSSNAALRARPDKQGTAAQTVEASDNAEPVAPPIDCDEVVSKEVSDNLVDSDVMSWKTQSPLSLFQIAKHSTELMKLRLSGMFGQVFAVVRHCLHAKFKRLPVTVYHHFEIYAIVTEWMPP